MGIKSAPGSQLPSPERSPPPSPPASQQNRPSLNLDDIPLERLTSRRHKYSIEDDTDSGVSDEEQTHKKKRSRFQNTARRLVRQHTGKEARYSLFRQPAASSSQTSLRSGQITPDYERDHVDYVPRPKAYNEGILSSLLKLYNEQGVGVDTLSHPLQTLDRKFAAGKEAVRGGKHATGASSDGTTPTSSKEASGQTTPKHQKWYYKDPSPSATPSIANLVSSSRMLAQPTAAPLTKAEGSTPAVQGKKAGMRPQRPQAPKRGSTGTLQTMFTMAKGPKPNDDEFKVHVRLFGAPPTLDRMFLKLLLQRHV